MEMKMKTLFKMGLIPMTCLIMPVYAAEPVNLMKQPFSAINSLSVNHSNISIMETKRSVDTQNNLHVRIQEMYSGYRVWGADAVVHIPKGAETRASLANAGSVKDTYMNGILYKNLKADLANAPAKIFQASQMKLAQESVVENYLHKIGTKIAVEEQKGELIVYIDSAHKAHWAYKVSFFVPTLKQGTLPARPVYIIDAVNFKKVYKKWDDIQTSRVIGGGFGGNTKRGKTTRLVYDGGVGNLASLKVSRDTERKICKLQNPDVVVKDKRDGLTIQYRCNVTDPGHNNVYWSGAPDAVHGGFSPGNDALFGGNTLKQMYQEWFNMPVLVNEDGTSMLLKMYVHSDEGDNAHWDGGKNIMMFGDGKDYFYPLTSIGIAGHEVSHGFTQQHSNLVYEGQSGGLNESFSDMAAQTAEAYVYGIGNNSWQMGSEVMRERNKALRYLDQPSKDCNGAAPGNECSIDDASQYFDEMDPHFSSGVFNRFFYLLSTAEGWNVKQAFSVMVQANSHYWTSEATFNSAACGVMQAATDLHLNVNAVQTAFEQVKVDYTDGGQCVIKS
jgi:pseudolysin